MKKLRIPSVRKIVRVLGALAILILLLLAVGPFLIPVNALEGLATAREAATEESQFITIPYQGTDGIEIHYVSRGSKLGAGEPTFVLMHGSLFNAHTWKEVLDFFGERGQVIAYDQIPYGLSEKLLAGDWSARNPYSSEAAVEQLFAFLDALDLDRVILVGSSFGGVLAVQAALSDPERVEALVLVDAAVYVQEEMPAWLMDLPQVRRLGPLFARRLGQDDGFIRMTYAEPDRISEERMALTKAHTQVAGWDFALWEYLRAWGTESLSVAERIPEVQQPVLVITGDGDTVVPVTDSERLDAELPHSELVVLPSCGHVPQEECPDAFEEAVGSWLSQGRTQD